MKADYVSSGILQALQLFPTFEFLKAILELPWSFGHSFIHYYFQYLYCIKDVCESMRLMYWERMQQYCESILALLDNNWSSDWAAHFVFAYGHLLHDLRYLLPRKVSHVDFTTHLEHMDVGAFGYTMLYTIGLATSVGGPYLYFNDITKISHDLMGDTEKEAIFAKSACFCLTLLCDERSASEDTGLIYGIARHDRRKKREHPWHWRQMVPRPPSPGNRLVLIGFRQNLYMDYKLKLTRIQKALRNSISYRYENTRVITMHEYFKFKSEPVSKTWPRSMKDKRPQQWPRYLFLLDMLPYILPLAGRYEPLVEMCRKKCLSSLSQVWPKKSRRARQAIDNYLRRMDSQGECEI
ncbi:hypothetical protein CPC08DRAFT_711722 [Agrocybe pediades]|nr:hypothetical protein CPC08DRAFT_711722 [Agrocybe pediades]